MTDSKNIAAMNKTSQVRKIAAFSDVPTGGNPAGVWVGDELPGPDVMQSIAAEVGFSETAFVVPASGRQRTVRYFSPEAEVPFCGHATIAAGFVLGAGDGSSTYIFATRAGNVPVRVESVDKQVRVSLTSVDTKQKPLAEGVLESALSILGWHEHELDETIPPAIAFAGAWHLVLAAASAERLSDLDYDFDKLKSLMQEHDLTTLQLVHRVGAYQFDSRNPFPVGGVVEDPATGAAAAALGGYLRDAGLIAVPARLTIRQGQAIGRPGELTVSVPEHGGITVSGTATDISA